VLPQAALEELVSGDFFGARRRAVLRRVAGWLRRERGTDRLLSFEEAREPLASVVEVYRGVRRVPAGEIVGSVARTRDFDRAFLPLRNDLAERWKRIDRLAHEVGGLEELAPVVLYKVGDAYFVLDGHFRVSVARYHGARYLRADVTELLPSMKRRRAGDPVPPLGTL
jgi:hypothetical protein